MHRRRRRAPARDAGCTDRALHQPLFATRACSGRPSRPCPVEPTSLGWNEHGERCQAVPAMEGIAVMRRRWVRAAAVGLLLLVLPTAAQHDAQAAAPSPAAWDLVGAINAERFNIGLAPL